MGSVQAQVPVEVSGLRFPVGAKDRVVWEAASGATAYRLYQGDGASLGGLATALPEAVRVLDTEVTESGPVLAATPPPNGLHWFLVSALNDSGESSLGNGRQFDPWAGSGPYWAFAEDFDDTVEDGPWPARWRAIGSVDDSRMNGGWARWRPVLSGYSLARIYAHGDERDVEVTFTFQFEDHRTQGVGFYVRQNGLYLDEPPAPVSQGYVVFLEDFRCAGTGNDCDRIGVWKEEDGVEIPLSPFYEDAALDFQDDVPYRVRFRVEQATPASTRLRARVWVEGQPEPDFWHVDLTDTTPVLQGARGGYAVDSWSVYRSDNPPPDLAYTGIRDIRIRRLYNPVETAEPAVRETGGYLFPEGPVWRDGVVLFSDIDGDAVHAWPPGGPAQVVRSPSGMANGLAVDGRGDLLACEHEGRRVSRMRADGSIETVTGDFEGAVYNSPNDLVVRGDGTLYFTDPRYGLDALGNTSETGVSGLYRMARDGSVSRPWSGDLRATAPNGVALSPDHRTLYVTDTDLGIVRAFEVLADGSLGAESTLITGLNVPDGMTVDMAGNLYIAQWNGTVGVFDPTGVSYGTLVLENNQVTNCAFGDEDRLGLYVTSGDGLYQVGLSQPGGP